MGTSVGEDITITRIIPSPNTLVNSSGGGNDSFEISPKVRFDTMREINDSDENIVGHYHSHPGKGCMPSNRDIESAFEPELVWLIIGTGKDGKALDMGAFRLNSQTRDVANIGINK